ncbi:S66 peptidase family protein [Saccharibacillus kuerlensis]|uniref:LD-carboxypeptidase n=1 Tax=Saccharibacillus kuerlensis TaxID=459527 RepID=A0ABQ2L5A4_9BACL|nr:S66 peptidase family protein [Saccharibacillus kuerlensis]GGO04073.1 LD-carboxypeptidase [Saccharibacillus kuerlensis]
MSAFQFKAGDTAALIACSDGLLPESRPRIDTLIKHLQDFGLRIVESRTLMRKDSRSPFSGSPAERADELNRLFADPGIAAIFDISGGDSANQILPLIDYKKIRSSGKPLFGLSDLTTVLNAVQTRSGIRTYHYRMMNLIGAYGERQREQFYRTFFKGESDLYDFDFEFLQGEDLNGDVIGGNLRCLLKLAGTPYWPDFSDKVLLLESLGGGANRIVSLLSQLSQTGALERCSGLLLGTFTELENRNEFGIVRDYVLELTQKKRIPIVKSDRIGHGEDAKCIILG